jgi:hypothetical protein
MSSSLCFLHHTVFLKPNQQNDSGEHIGKDSMYCTDQN